MSLMHGDASGAGAAAQLHEGGSAAGRTALCCAVPAGARELASRLGRGPTRCAHTARASQWWMPASACADRSRPTPVLLGTPEALSRCARPGGIAWGAAVAFDEGECFCLDL
jgi:hypothetical protein